MTDLSIVLPTYNEAQNISRVILELEDLLKSQKIKGEIIVVDDNSPDQTAKVVEKLQKRFSNLRLINGEQKKGIGAALKKGYDAANGEWVLSMDADGSIKASEIPRLLLPLEQGVDLVLGSKYLSGATYRKKNWMIRFRSIISELGNRYISLVTKIPVRDFSLNFRVFKKKVWKKIRPKDLQNFFLVEMIILAKRQKFKIKEIPTSFLERNYGDSKTRVWGQSAQFLIRATQMALEGEKK